MLRSIVLVTICNDRASLFLQPFKKRISVKYTINKISSFFAATLLVAGSAAAQSPTIRFTSPSKETVNVSSPKQFIVGLTCKDCSVTVNNEPVRVYSTGTFGYEAKLAEGTNVYKVESRSSGKTLTKTITYNYTKPAAEIESPAGTIEYVRTVPEGNMALKPGDVVRFKVKAEPGADVRTFNNTPLYEQPRAQANGIGGIYQGQYIVQPGDSFPAQQFPIVLRTKSGNTVSSRTSNTIGVYSPLGSDVAITKGRLAYLEFGLGDDRLGGSKIGYLDEGIPLQIIGKFGEDYKVRLSKNRSAYINMDNVTLAPKGTVAGGTLTGSWRVSGDDKYDYVSINTNAKLPYQSLQMVNPSKLVVDIFGVVNNSNWISQLTTAKEVKSVDYEQVADEVYRVTINLNHEQFWGHKIYYSGNNLVIRIKQQPKSLALKDLTIGLDAGHGGSNNGATGTTGASEKSLTLAISLKIKKLLEAEGAKVISTRTTETSFGNSERILHYRDNEPDLLVSIHLNSAGDPFNAGGTSTFYKYVGFRPLSMAIYKRMLELGLKEYGNVGSFNFMLNSPTEYPNALVETLFLSNLEEESLILQEDYQQRMAGKIVQGIKDFLDGAK